MGSFFISPQIQKKKCNNFLYIGCNDILKSISPILEITCTNKKAFPYHRKGPEQILSTGFISFAFLIVP